MFKKILCLTLVFAVTVLSWAEDIQTVMSYYKPDMSKGFIFISKADMTLTLVNSQGKSVLTYPIACGRVKGQKKSRGDNRTPEGHFLLQNIHDASSWGHDFRDGKGFIKHAYGPWFLRLQTGFAGIGIHGTHAPESIGTRASEGCIRLDNSNLANLKQKVSIGMPVIIGPESGVQMLIANNVPSPKVAGSKGLTGAVLASNKTVSTKTITSKTESTKPAKTATTESKMPEEEVKVVTEPIAATVEPASVKVVEGGMLDVEPETDLVISMPETPVIDTKAETQQQAITEVVVEQEAAPAEQADPVAAAEPEPQAVPQSTSKEPRYEVVVEEVTGPDGEVKFEVRYKLVE